MSAQKPTFRATIKFLLLNIPVRAFNTASDRNDGISFKQLCPCHDAPISQVLKCRTTDLEVARPDIKKGYEHSKGKFVAIAQQVLDDLHPDSTRVLDIQHAVPVDTVPSLLFEGSSYYLAPDGPVAEEAFAVMLSALRGRMAFGTMPIYQRDRLAAVTAEGKTLVMHLMKTPDAIRSADDVIDRLPDVRPESAALATSLVDGMTIDHFDPAAIHFTDNYRQSVIELVKSLLTGVPLPTPAPVVKTDTKGLQDALLASLDAVKRQAAVTKAEAEVTTAVQTSIKAEDKLAKAKKQLKKKKTAA